MAVSVVDANSTRPDEKIPPLHRDVPPLPRLKGKIMIKKIEPIKSFDCSDTLQAKMQHHSYHNDCINKINELVDAVNALVYEHDKDSDWYDGQTRSENVQDPTKWLGKLCKFWDGDEQMSHLRWGILSTITPTSPLPFCCSLGDGKTFDYEHCEPVKPDDDIIYKGE